MTIDGRILSQAVRFLKQFSYKKIIILFSIWRKKKNALAAAAFPRGSFLYPFPNQGSYTRITHKERERETKRETFPLISFLHMQCTFVFHFLSQRSASSLKVLLLLQIHCIFSITQNQVFYVIQTQERYVAIATTIGMLLCNCNDT